MAIDTSLFINIISQFKTKGIKDAEKGFKGLDKRTATLNKSLGILARRVAVFETLRRSFKGFIEDDAAARRLNTTLNNLGLTFSALGVEEYLNTLEKATAVNNDQLRPSFESLARVTGDFEQTQSLLNTALDVAAGTGQDVTSVSKALARAYAGNTTALSRLNAGLSKATLTSGNFALIQERLNDTFAGQAANQVSTYQGQIELLKIAAQDAGDAIGKGMVDGLVALSGGDVRNAVNFIVASGETIGKIFRGVAAAVKSVADVFGRAFTGKGFFDAESQLELFEKYQKASDPASVRALARERRKALEEENKAAAKLARTRAKDAAAQKKALADQKKAEQDKLKLQTAGELFDDERISIAAALRNESLDRNEILRLELKRALINENADRAEKLAGQLRDSQRELAALQAFKLANPFKEWEESLNRVRAGVASLGVPVGGVSSTGTALGQEKPGVPVGGVSSTGTALGQEKPLAGTGIDPFAGTNLAGVTIDDIREGFGGGALGDVIKQNAPQAYVNVYVSGTGGLDAQAKQDVVDAVVEASSAGFATGWFRTTNRATL